MSHKIVLEAVLEPLKAYLPQYLESQGVQISRDNMFSCINPEHPDVNPSSGLIPGTDNKVFHCFGCQLTGSVFLAAHLLEGRPLSGRGFISDNVIPLAKQFGVELPSMGSELTDEQLYEMDIRRAYNDASSILKSSQFSDSVNSRLADLGWSRDTRFAIGIGSVTSHADYLNKMVKHYGHRREFLTDNDLDRTNLFHPDNLIFTVRDEYGAPVGFAARNLKFETEYEVYVGARQALEQGTGDEAHKRELIQQLYLPVKYNNTSEKCRIYQKSKRLFNFNLARKHAPPLYIFEGYPDATTAWQAGLRNSSAIGSTSFSAEHLNLIISTGIQHLIFVLDADKGGQKGTERFVKLLEDSLGGHVGLRAEIVVMPDGSDDPDRYIRSFGYTKGKDAFKALEVIDIFTWSLKRGLAEGKDPIALASDSIPLVVNQQNYILRMSMVEKLAKQTGLDKNGLWREVLRQVDNDHMRLEEEKTTIARRTARELEKNSTDIQNILEGARHEVEMIERSRISYDPTSVLKAVQHTCEVMATIGAAARLKTGYPLLDQALEGGFPSQVFISVPGKPGASKTTWLDNLAFQILDHNSDAIVLYHSVDDALSIRIPRIQGARFRVPSRYFLDAGKYLDQPPRAYPNFAEIHGKAQQWLYSMVQNERLILVDVNGLPQQLNALDGWIRNLRQKFPTKRLVVMGDNFHLFKIPGKFNSEVDRVQEMSQFIKTMSNRNDATMFFTMELPKEALRPGVRPRMGKIKGSAAIPYDINLNMGIYNDMKDMGERAELYWSDPEQMDMSYGPNGEEIITPRRKPIIEVVMDKSKMSGFDGSIFYRLDPDSGCFDECSAPEQDLYRIRASLSMGQRMHYAADGPPANPAARPTTM